MVFIFLLLHIPDRSNNKHTLRSKLQQLNIEGQAVLIPGVVCLCLALQWGVFTYTVSSRISLAALFLPSWASLGWRN